jgi:hypothetical protein
MRWTYASDRDRREPEEKELVQSRNEDRPDKAQGP